MAGKSRIVCEGSVNLKSETHIFDYAIAESLVILVHVTLTSIMVWVNTAFVAHEEESEITCFRCCPEENDQQIQRGLDLHYLKDFGYHQKRYMLVSMSGDLFVVYTMTFLGITGKSCIRRYSRMNMV